MYSPFCFDMNIAEIKTNDIANGKITFYLE